VARIRERVLCPLFPDWRSGSAGPSRRIAEPSQTRMCSESSSRKTQGKAEAQEMMTLRRDRGVAERVVGGIGPTNPNRETSGTRAKHGQDWPRKLTVSKMHPQ
jgi:hypothetical protein